MATEKKYEDFTELGQWALATLAAGEVQAIMDASVEDTYDVCVTINGVEVDFEEVLKSMEEQYDYQVKKEAKAFVEEAIGNRMSDLLYILDDTILDLKGELD